MLSWDPVNLRSGPLLIHLNGADDYEITQQVVSKKTYSEVDQSTFYRNIYANQSFTNVSSIASEGFVQIFKKRKSVKSLMYEKESFITLMMMSVRVELAKPSHSF